MMNSTDDRGKHRRAVCPAAIATALGIGYALVRARRKQQRERWRVHLQRGPVGTALVTGASAGIGRAYALQLAELGHHLVLVARRGERLEALATECSARYGVTAEPLPADLSTDEGIARVERRIAEGDIDFLVNCAGYDVFGDFAEVSIDEAIGLIRCLALSAIRLSRAALPAMIEHRRGAIVNVSSIGSFTPKRKDAVYLASKAFINRFTETLALELKDSGVRTQALCPGFTMTEFHDAPQFSRYHIKERIPRWMWMSPERVVGASLRALGEDRVMCVPGLGNQAIVAVAQTGLTWPLVRVLGSLLRVRRSSTRTEAAPDILACPECHGSLTLEGTLQEGAPQEGAFTCPTCNKTYPIVEGIPHFAPYAGLEGLNRRFAGLYDWFSIVYGLYSRIAFAFIGTTEAEARSEILDRLEAHGRVLEVSVGPGVNLPFLREYPQVTEIHGLDLSNGQLARCRAFAQRRNWPVALYQGNAEALPYQDDTFDAVLHIGGINFFNDKQKAIAEMIRVARPGAKIVICDECERGAKGYERTLPGFKGSFRRVREVVRPPVDLVPPEMEEIRLDETAWKGWFYCLEFRKPGGVSP